MPTPKPFPSMRITRSVRNLVIIFGDQLDHDSVAFDGFDLDRDAVLLMEVEQESAHVPSHRQRTVLFLAAMRHFAIEACDKGRRVQYTRLDDPHNTQQFDSEIRRHCKRLQPERLVCMLPGEWRVRKMLEELKSDLDAELELRPDDHFLVQPEEFADWADGRKSLTMEYFYREQRKRLNVLLTKNGEPVGGEWNYDSDNREVFKASPRVRDPYRARPDAITREVIELVERRLPDLPGRLDTFDWPVTRDEARRALRDFRRTSARPIRHLSRRDVDR